MADLETTFGLESNVAVVEKLQADRAALAAGETPAAEVEKETPAAKKDEPKPSEIETITSAIEDLEGSNDNLARLDKVAAQRAKDAAAKPEDDAADAGDEKEVVADDVKAELAKEKGDDAPAGAPPVDDGEWTPETAQEQFDYVIENWADKVMVPFKANGAEQKVSIAKLKDMAAGYMGQGAVHETLKQATAEREKTEKLLKDGGGPAQKTLDAMFKKLEDPKAFVKDVLVGAYEGDEHIAYLTQLHEEIGKVIDDAEKNPAAFEARRANASLQQQISDLTALVKSGAQKPAAEPHEAEKPTKTAAGVIPADFGFKPDIGYPEEYGVAVLSSLDTAAKAIGRDEKFVDEVVVPKWKAEKMKRPLTEVFSDAVKAATAESAKLDAAKKPPIRKLPAGRSGTKTGEQKKPSGNGAWEDIEGIVAREVGAAQKAGRV